MVGYGNKVVSGKPQGKKAVFRALTILIFTSWFGVFYNAMTLSSFFISPVAANGIIDPIKIEYGEWLLPDTPPSPQNNPYNKAQAEIGKMLFFDPRLSGDGKISCATCHNPALGWADGLPTGRGHNGKVLPRATPTIFNVGFNKILMWDGRAGSLEEQAMGPITNPDEMHNTIKNMLNTLRNIDGYVKAFKKAFYTGISENIVRRAIAQYQRAVIANDSPFDRWVKGNKKAMTQQQIRGFLVFKDPGKANCAQCHQPPNFTDYGFHNIGLASYGKKNHDRGRNGQIAVALTDGAFKTPTLRNITQTAPYFHDGSAATLDEVIEHYASGGKVKTNLSPNMIAFNITKQEKADLIAFLNALTSPWDPQLEHVQLPN